MSTDPAVVPGADLDVVRFWDDRHGASAERSSGGHITLGEHGNHALYTIRLAQLMELLGATHSPAAPDTVLDAGCGKGIFAHGLAQAGVRVSAFDPSEQAVARCRRAAGPLEDYHVSTAAEFETDLLFDLVYSVDVMFHIMSDDVWQASVERLCRLVRLGGRIALVDHDRADEVVWGQYQRTRPPARYHDLYRRHGIEPIGLRRCGPPGYPTAFILGRRVR